MQLKGVSCAGTLCNIETENVKYQQERNVLKSTAYVVCREIVFPDKCLLHGLVVW